MRVLRSLIAATSCAASTFVACDESLPPQGQIVLYIDADAPLVRASSPIEPLPLFDRLLVEIHPPDEVEPCPGCRREIVVDAALMAERRFSLGIVPRPGLVGYRARLVLYRGASGLPSRAGSSIELVGYLPAVGQEGKKAVTARFRTDDLGRPRGSLASPILFEPGAPAASAIGTWPGARVIDCDRPAPAGAVCVPGGAFWMGDPRVTIEGDAVAGATEHLVIVPPFFLDSSEVSVGRIRATNLVKLDARGRALDPRDDLGDVIAGRCDYSSASGANESLPVNCVSWELARSYCRAKGGDLPSEAELEIVATLRGTALSPWGDREPSCAEARASGCGDVDELSMGRRELPAPAGSGARDRVALPGGEILDLGANLAEWTRDAFEADDGACWSAPILTAPSCVSLEAHPRRSVKGADLLTRPAPFAQARRGYDSSDTSLAHVGFRCAYPAR